MESIIIALITAIGSIIVAVIQASSAFKVARMKSTLAQQMVIESKVYLQTGTEVSAKIWLWVGGVLIISALIWQILLPWESPYIIHFAAIPWATCLLAYFCPIRWGFVAGIVTLLNVITMFSYFAIGASYTDDDIVLLSITFTINAVLASGIAYWRSKNRN